MTPEFDQIFRFTFANHDVRGEIVRLKDSYQSLIEGHSYPETVQRLLGELMTVTSLLTATLKFKGHINVQLQGDGPLNVMTVNGSHDQSLRGMARLTKETESANLRELVGNKAYLIITLTPEQGERYQGVVAVEHDSLAQVIESYFAQSEQLATRIWLHANPETGQAAGFFLQVLPGTSGNDTGFEHATALANTLTDAELLQLPVRELLHRLYHEETVELYPEQPVRFYCGCSKERTAEALKSIEYSELTTIIEEDGELRLTCDYCLTDYVYDAIDIAALHGHEAPSKPQ